MNRGTVFVKVSTMKEKKKTHPRYRVCVCVILPVQTAPQSQGHPDTWGPLLAITVPGRPLPAGGGS